MTTVAIHQPNYLPWLGYFRKIAKCRTFVFFDNVQMPGGKSFVSRNRILGSQGPIWLTVPVQRAGLDTLIAHTRIADQFWPKKHLRTLEVTYARTPGFKPTLDALHSVLREPKEFIADLNVALIARIAGLLALEVEFVRAFEMNLSSMGASSIPEILQRTGATLYVTGRGAGTQRHLDEAELEVQGVRTEFVSGEFRAYPQRGEGFDPHLSIVDALFNCGPERTRDLLLEQA